MTELQGRTIRAVDVTPAELADHADAIEQIHQDRLDAIVLRGAFPEPLREHILARLEAGDLPWLRPNSSGPQADIHVLGNAATPTFNTPSPAEAHFGPPGQSISGTSKPSSRASTPA